jgi:hypothetical protein
METVTCPIPRTRAEPHRIIKCRIKVTMPKGAYEYAGIYYSTIDAMLDALAQFGVECRISVRPM